MKQWLACATESVPPVRKVLAILSGAGENPPGFKWARRATGSGRQKPAAAVKGASDPGWVTQESFLLTLAVSMRAHTERK